MLSRGVLPLAGLLPQQHLGQWEKLAFPFQTQNLKGAGIVANQVALAAGVLTSSLFERNMGANFPKGMKGNLRST